MNLEPLKAQGAEVLVATDADEVMAVLAKHRIPGIMTDIGHASGTDRCAEAARGRVQPFVLNVQGDEPFVDANDLAALCMAVESRAEADMGTLVYESRDLLLATDPNTVKALRRSDGYALYFSRAAVPYDRDSVDKANHAPKKFWQHLGVYAFRRERLESFGRLPPSPLEQTEKLEQLRALENGWRIYLAPASKASRGIDTPEDLEVARGRL